MRKLAREIAIHIVADHGPAKLLRRLADPFWFQAFGCVLGFDWHSSGVTTTVTAALKEGIRGLEHDLVCSRRGARARHPVRRRRKSYNVATACQSRRMARRYHWLSESLTSFVSDPHEAICCDTRIKRLATFSRASSPASH
jgi:uncharacterized protein